MSLDVENRVRQEVHSRQTRQCNLYGKRGGRGQAGLKNLGVCGWELKLNAPSGTYRRAGAYLTTPASCSMPQGIYVAPL